MRHAKIYIELDHCSFSTVSNMRERNCFITFPNAEKTVAKCNAQQSIFDELLGLCKCDETLSVVFDYLLN